MVRNSQFDYDVIVVGGGHAGIEAAYAAARMGSKTLLLTLDVDKVGLMPCNPSVGGVGKGHIVYEVSALGGMMPQLCTQTYLQARMLNTKKGPAVQGLRLQIDKYAYNKLAKQRLDHVDNLTLANGTVDQLIINDSRIEGIITNDGTRISAPTVVITTGTFLNGLIHIGMTRYSAGRQGEHAVANLSEFLSRAGLRLGRLKTGTPPRLLQESIDYSKLERQEPDNLDYLFEFYPHKAVSSRTCFIAHTNEKTHKIIKDNLHLSAMYSGNIKGIGPRYCPSIEDKIARFPDKTSHHVFVEPEGANINEVYPSGLSTSLPAEVQKAYIQSIVGFENAVIARPGYAVEYDFVLPDQLKHSLETKTISGLFLAGQINGTTGYEEAAGQGIVAGINASLKAHNKEPFILDRNESYIGVMIDDLVSMSVDEPYRMFTSRAERRLTLRQDNAFLRLTDRAYHLGLIEKQLYTDFQNEKQIVNQTLSDLRAGHTHAQLLKLFGADTCSPEGLRPVAGTNASARALQTIQAEIHYEPYLKREEKESEKARYYQSLEIPHDFPIVNLPGLSKELQQKIGKHRPQTIAQAALIPGMTPAALSLLIFKIREHTR